MPTFHQKEELVRTGGLVAYGTSFEDTWGRAAYFVDRILKGATPSELPVEQASALRLTINLKTAKALGVKVPQPVLGRADEVIQRRVADEPDQSLPVSTRCWPSCMRSA